MKQFKAFFIRKLKSAYQSCSNWICMEYPYDDEM